MQPTENQALIRQVFNDSNIVGRILGNIPTKNFVHDHLNYRAVNKTFRNVCNGSEVEVFTGMDNICHPGCKDCLEIAKQCYEYGPVQLNYLTTQPTIPKHFKKLIITDYLLDDIANECIRPSVTKSNCMDALSALITTVISCDTLQLNVSKNRRNLNTLGNNTVPMPREVLDAILLKWNLKSIVLKIVGLTRQEFQEGKWLKFKWFKRFRFNADLEAVNLSSLDLKFQKVEVDFSEDSISSEIVEDYETIAERNRAEPEYAIGDIINIPLPRESNRNTITNILRVLPTDRISIRYCHFAAPYIRNILHRLAIREFKDDYEDLEVDLQLVINNEKRLSCTSKQEERTAEMIIRDLNEHLTSFNSFKPRKLRKPVVQ
ncbi:unnamed protein product [Caenorhabditis nigoni]